MAKAKVKHGKLVYEINNLPMTLPEMSFEDMVQFIGLYNKFIIAGEESNANQLMIDAVCSFDTNFKFLDFGSEDLEELRKQGYTIQMGQPLTIKRLFIHFETRLVDAFSEYLIDILEILNIPPNKIKQLDTLKIDKVLKNNIKAAIGGDLVTKYLAILQLSKQIGDVKNLTNDLEIEVGGESFYILQSDVKKFMFDEFAGGEFIHINEFRRRIELEAKQNKIKGYDGFLDFKLGMNEMSILLRKKDVRLPMSPTKLDRFIREQTQFFRKNKLSALDVLNVRFFLIFSMAKYAIQKICKPSGIRPTTTLVQEITPSSISDRFERRQSANKFLIK